MAKEIKFIIKLDNADMKLDLSRFEKQYQKAQYELDSMVMDSMVPYMPMQTGTFIKRTRAESASLAGTGTVVAGAGPMGRYLYEGKAMVGEKSRSAWAKKGERKVVTKNKLHYSAHSNPKAQSHWFEAAKKAHGSQWIKKTKAIAGGG